MNTVGLKQQRMFKRRTLVILGIIPLVFLGLFLFRSKVAFSAPCYQGSTVVACDDKFMIVMPAATSSSRGGAVHLEIAQTGEGNTLDADKSWVKYYIDEARINDATIGIHSGGYGGEVDTFGTARGNVGQRLPYPDAVQYDFYLAETKPLQGVPEEVPCQMAVAGQTDSKGDPFQTSLTVNSNSMPVDGWYKVAASRFFNGARCRNDRWQKTEKSGKYVLFVRASWISNDPPIVNGKRQGRVNAFKAGAAYANSTGFYDSPITGYWADATSAYLTQNPQNMPTRAAYSIQDRTSPINTNGSYTFTFQPDCRLAPGQEEFRYLHWKDVDYPLYYGGDYPKQDPPEFDLYEIPPGQTTGRSVLHVDEKSGKFNGDKQNQHFYARYDSFKGGYTYKWVWKNIARVDGVSFWIPYDDYPSLAGCGEWNHDFTMKAGVLGQGLSTQEFRVAGGQTARINLNQFAKGKDAGPETDVNLTVSAVQNGSVGQQRIVDTFAGVSSTLGGGKGTDSTYARGVVWNDLGRLGPSPTYPSSRTDIYADYKIKNDAPDGAKYCATAYMTPKSSSDNGRLTSNPQQICFVIDNSLRPYITTQNGDVHAGDCTVRDRPNNGRITGQGVAGVAGSSGTYIVSAGDAITKFGSGGSPDSANLTFGKTGRYGSVCRPSVEVLNGELVKAKESGKAIEVPATGTYNLGALNPALYQDKSVILKFSGPGTVQGVSRVPVTVVSDSTLTIIRTPGGTDFGTNTGYQADKSNLPVVGVIAQNINITQDVAKITAQLYAVNKIDTCSDTNAVNCKKSLELRGFAMAREFAFKRSTNKTNGLQQSELFGFNAAFYLNPPPGFGSPAGTVKYLGERAPLY